MHLARELLRCSLHHVHFLFKESASFHSPTLGISADDDHQPAAWDRPYGIQSTDSSYKAFSTWHPLQQELQSINKSIIYMTLFIKSLDHLIGKVLTGLGVTWHSGDASQSERIKSLIQVAVSLCGCNKLHT